MNSEQFSVMLDCANFVSTIPLVHGSRYAFLQETVCLRNAELLDLAAGSVREHAVLLAGYFLQLGIEVCRTYQEN